MTRKIDYAIGGLVGFFAGVAAIPTAYAVGVHAPLVLLALPWVGAVCIVAGVWLGGLLSRWMPVFAQLARFAAVGILNTAIDFGVLNLVSRALGITAGFILGGVNIPGFAVAVVNSYFWNKLWVFRDHRQDQPVMSDFPTFFAVTLVGVGINSGLVILLTTYLPILSGLAPSARLNLAKIVATMATLIWNFLGYKLVVFRRSSPTA
jgi:putative flippase GtrA